MGLIKASVESVKSMLGDQWKEFFYCDAIDVDTLVVKGRKKTSGRSSNVNGSDNVISNGSGIAVADGQCMLIVDQGEVVEICAEPGEYTYDMSTEASVFAGDLGKSIVDSFMVVGKRIAHGGDTGTDQRVYYINTKEITDNKFGTANPFLFRVVDHNINLDREVSVRCNGIYSYRITDPVLFYKNVCGNITGTYDRGELDPQLKTEFIGALQPAFAKLSDLELRPSQIPSHAAELEAALNEVLTAKWSQKRGISVVSVAMNPITLKEEDLKMIQQAQDRAVLKDAGMAAATLVGAQAEAMKAAAANDAGAMMGFMGLNMAAQAGGMNINELYQMNAAREQQKAQQSAAAAKEAGWTCSCGAVNKGKFCTECGKPKPEAGWTCSCGAVNKGKFCTECGKPKPTGAPLYRCDKCGWEPADPTNPPKFCPECGDRFDDADVK